MKMTPWLVCLLIGAGTQISSAQSAPIQASLCELQRRAKQGEQRSVQVAGEFGPSGVLTDPTCDSDYTWVKWDLRSTANKEALLSLLHSKRHVDVVFEGDFLGPPLPSPNLPEAIRKSYHPGWGHNGAFNTQLVVHVIRSVKVGK